MQRDGRNSFFRQLNLDKKVMKILQSFREIKEKMLKDKVDSYINGKINSKTE